MSRNLAAQLEALRDLDGLIARAGSVRPVVLLAAVADTEPGGLPGRGFDADDKVVLGLVAWRYGGVQRHVRDAGAHDLRDLFHLVIEEFADVDLRVVVDNPDEDPASRRDRERDRESQASSQRTHAALPSRQPTPRTFSMSSAPNFFLSA